MANKYRGMGDGKNNDPYLPPANSMDGMMLHFKEMYDAGIRAGFTPEQSMQMILVSVKTAIETGIQQNKGENE